MLDYQTLRDVCISTVSFCPTMWGHPKPTRMFRFEYNHSIINHKQNWVCHQHWVHELWVRSSQPRLYSVPGYLCENNPNLAIWRSYFQEEDHLLIWWFENGVYPPVWRFIILLSRKRFHFGYVSFSDQPKYQIEMIKLVIKLYDFPLYSIRYNEHYTPLVTTINTIINTIKQQGFFHYTPFSIIHHYDFPLYTIFQRIFPEDFQRQEISRWPWCHLKVCCAAAAAQWLERPMAPGGRAEIWVWKKHPVMVFNAVYNRFFHIVHQLDLIFDFVWRWCILTSWF